MINRKQIASAAYREKYNALPETKKVQRKVCSGAGEILRHRDGTAYEDLAYIDSKTGNVIINKSYDEIRISKPNRKQNKMLKEADDYTIIGIHNHSRSSVLGLNDLVVTRNRKYEYGMVIYHDGTIYKYTIVGKLNAINLAAALDLMAIRGYSDDIVKWFLDAGVEMEVL